MLRHRFNPNLATYVPGTLQEIEYAVGNEFPEGGMALCPYPLTGRRSSE